MAKHAKKMIRSEKRLSGVRKPARKTSKIFSVYIYRVLKQVHPELGISSKAMEVMNNFMTDIFHRLSEESAGLVKFSRKSTLTSSDIQTAARLALPGELSKHAVSEGTKAVARFLASKKESASAPVVRGQPPAVIKRVQQEPPKPKEAPPVKRVAKEGMATAVKGPPPPAKGIPPQKTGNAKNLAEAKRRQQEEEQREREEQEMKRKEEAEAKKREAEAKKREAEAKKQEAEAKKREVEAKKQEQAEVKKQQAEAKKQQAEVKKQQAEAKKREEAEAKKRKQEEAEAVKRKKQEEEDRKRKLAAEESRKGPEEEEEEADEDRDKRSLTPPRETQAPDSTTQTRPVEIVIPIRPEKRSSLRSYRKQQGAGPEPDVIRIEAHVPEPAPSSQESLPESSQESALSYTMGPSSQETDYSQATDDSQRTDFTDYGSQESSFTSETAEGDRQTVVTVTYTRVTATAVVTTPGGRNRSHTSEHSFAEADQNTEEAETAA